MRQQEIQERSRPSEALVDKYEHSCLVLSKEASQFISNTRKAPPNKRPEIDTNMKLGDFWFCQSEMSVFLKSRKCIFRAID
jgi:hypothetical protein